jgi:hypothetical protein
MREKEWMECDDPKAMLKFVGGKASDRKLRLFACACCRRVWRLMRYPWCRLVVEISERYADGQADTGELQLSRAISLHLRKPGDSHQEEAANGAGLRGAFDAAVTAATNAAAAAAADVISSNPELHRQASEYQPTWRAGQYAQQYQQCQLLRDIFGNPFRPVTINPARLTPTVTSLAQAAYEERTLPSGELDPARLAVLADALEEAGADAVLLEHLRGPGPHVRGCWAVDCLTGRE